MGDFTKTVFKAYGENMRKINKDEFRKKFIQHFCSHEWFPHFYDHNRILYVCTKCGKRMDEARMLEQEMEFDKM